MDSANSGSSSAGDDEYDSRADAPISNQPFFDDPLSNYPNSSWPGIRSDPDPVNSSAFVPPAFHPPPAAVPARNPKKRSRASRRAPTTVLTTDTSNFRAMVQEFTGIPAPPFDCSSFPRPRLDLFRSAAHPPPLRRPFAQKVPFPGSSSSALAGNDVNSYRGSSTNLFQNQFLSNFINPNPSPFQISPPNDRPQYGNHYTSGVEGDGGNFSGGKQPENNAAGNGEGMVESWICSSE